MSTAAVSVAAEKSVRECTKELTRTVFDLSESKATAICKKYSQKAVDCAVRLKREKPLSFNLDSALEDCDRKSEI